MGGTTMVLQHVRAMAYINVLEINIYPVYMQETIIYST
jgi:hypothetical protein